MISNYFNFLWVLKSCSNKHGYNFDYVNKKLVSLRFLKIQVFWNKSYDVIISFHDVINKILSPESIYIVEWSCEQILASLAFLWEKLS